MNNQSERTTGVSIHPRYFRKDVRVCVERQEPVDRHAILCGSLGTPPGGSAVIITLAAAPTVVGLWPIRWRTPAPRCRVGSREQRRGGVGEGQPVQVVSAHEGFGEANCATEEWRRTEAWNSQRLRLIGW